ncbi:AAA family ATPase [Streptomyces nanhaiensis]|uniref:AAA family ATPase n=1 Tax=Streptomyces nanhaiensis TaxID=679319 RepID=UPI00399CE1B3
MAGPPRPPAPGEGPRARPELAVLVGLQGSGKTTFRARCLPAEYTVVSKDLFPRSARHRQRRQMRLVEEALERGRPVVVDNTNPSPLEWAPLIAAGRAYGARVVAYWFPPDVPNALARNAARQGRERVPEAGFFDTLRRLREPRRSDGFDAVREVRIDGRGGFEVRDVPDARPDTRPEDEGRGG